MHTVTEYVKNINLTRVTFASLAFTFVISLISPVSAVFAAESSAKTDGSSSVTTSEVSSALSHTSGILESSDATNVSSSNGSAIKAVAANSSVNIPKDASDGVVLGSTNGEQSIEISLPNADGSKDAQTIANGTVAYPANNGSANAVQATEDGGVRMLTVIDNPNAPTKYEYKISIPDGGTITLTSDGGAVILDNLNKPLAFVDKPWAKDANGIPVETYFVTDGTSLRQVVKHSMPGIVYPVTADPQVDWAWHGVTLYLSRPETSMVAWSTGAAGAYFGWTGFGGLIAYGAGPAAQWATTHGYCLAIYKSNFYWSISPWAYRC
jgi:hypothetical protein